MRKTFSRSRPMLLLTIGIIVLCLGLAAVVLQKMSASGANSQLSDEEIAQDLSVLEKAIWEHGKLLPESLQDMSVNGLKGHLQDYQYRITQQYEGGPGESFALCATFHSRSAKLDDPNFQPNFAYSSPEAYTYHSQGKQCYTVSWNIHEGESSVGIMDRVPDWAKNQ